MLFRDLALLRVRDVVRLLVLERLEQIGMVDIHMRYYTILAALIFQPDPLIEIGAKVVVLDQFAVARSDKNASALSVVRLVWAELKIHFRLTTKRLIVPVAIVICFHVHNPPLVVFTQRPSGLIVLAHSAELISRQILQALIGP